MPPTSEQLPLLGIYYAITICIVSLSTAMTVVTLNINNKGLRGQEVPKLAKKIFLKYIAKVLGIKLEINASKDLFNTRSLNIKMNTTVAKQDIQLNLKEKNFPKFNFKNIGDQNFVFNTDNINLESK